MWECGEDANCGLRSVWGFPVPSHYGIYVIRAIPAKGQRPGIQSYTEVINTCRAELFSQSPRRQVPKVPSPALFFVARMFVEEESAGIFSRTE
jgi:hypothetical protein